jgi:ATP-dependent DNA helicase PIF1
MIGRDYFTKLEAVARAVRQCKQPFGGVRLVLCGDFLQLPPVTDGDDKKNYCFQV